MRVSKVTCSLAICVLSYFNTMHQFLDRGASFIITRFVFFHHNLQIFIFVTFLLKTIYVSPFYTYVHLFYKFVSIQDRVSINGL